MTRTETATARHLSGAGRSGWFVLCLAVALTSAPAERVLWAQEADDFVPVTDAVLQDPDPADWLHWRRTLDAWGHSPLDQITSDNADQLRLVWSWALADGRQQTTPLVYDGVMYIANPGQLVQALDASTGEFLWEHRRPSPPARTADGEQARRGRPLETGGPPEPRHLSGQGLPEHDRRSCRRASTRGPVRRGPGTPTSLKKKGFEFTSGSIIADGKVVAGLTACGRFPGRHVLHRGARRRTPGASCGARPRWPDRVSRAATRGAISR